MFNGEVVVRRNLNPNQQARQVVNCSQNTEIGLTIALLKMGDECNTNGREPEEAFAGNAKSFPNPSSAGGEVRMQLSLYVRMTVREVPAGDVTTSFVFLPTQSRA
jgi:hypothetical protein